MQIFLPNLLRFTDIFAKERSKLLDFTLERTKLHDTFFKNGTRTHPPRRTMAVESARWLPRAVVMFLVIRAIDPCFTNEYAPPSPTVQCSCRGVLSATPTGYAEHCGGGQPLLRLRGGTGRQRKSTAVSIAVYAPFAARALYLHLHKCMTCRNVRM